MTNNGNIATVLAESVQSVPDAEKQGTGLTSIRTQRLGDVLPTWGTRAREFQLRAFERNDYNNLVQGAISGLIKKVIATPWEIKGPKTGVQYWQDVLLYAQFGYGWRRFLMGLLRDYFRQDIGGFVEIIGPGDPTGPITGQVSGLAFIDALECWPTGDAEHPVMYQPRSYTTRGGDSKNKWHLLHPQRVYQMVDMLDSDAKRPSIGLCGVSRAMGVVTREILMGKYIESKLDDMPPPGFTVVNNMSEKQRDDSLGEYYREQTADRQKPWGKTIWFFGLQPDFPITVENIAFSQPPEKFDYRVYKADIDTRELALALGVDPQDIWPLTSSSMGTATQSEVLHNKGLGKSYGDCLRMLERFLNTAVLPPDYEFSFKFADEEQDLQQAQTAQTWANFANQVSATMTPDEQRRLLANTVEVYRNVVTDEDGVVIRLDDADVPGTEDDNAVIAEDAAPETAAPDEQEAQIDDMQTRWFKDFNTGSTRAEFAANLRDLVRGAQLGEINRQRFGIVLRAQLRNYGQRAFRDGRSEGGVPTSEPLDDRELNAVNEWLSIQVGFIPNFADRVFNTELSEAQITTHAEMWANKSLRDAYQLGQASGQWNQPMRWVLGPTNENCDDCSRLNGQIHRWRDWQKKGLTPGSENLSCKGYNCLCTLEPAPGEAARGRF